MRERKQVVVQIDIILDSEPNGLESIYKVVGWLKGPNNHLERQRYTFGYIRMLWSGDAMYEEELGSSPPITIITQHHMTYADTNSRYIPTRKDRGDEVFWGAKVWKNGKLVRVNKYEMLHRGEVVERRVYNSETCVLAMLLARYGGRTISPIAGWNQWVAVGFTPIIQRDDTEKEGRDVLIRSGCRGGGPLIAIEPSNKEDI